MAIPLPSKVSKSEEFTLNRDSWQAAGLKAWYPLGADNSGKDWSGYGNHGTIVLFGMVAEPAPPWLAALTFVP
jgi:hypothetical protein